MEVRKMFRSFDLREEEPPFPAKISQDEMVHEYWAVMTYREVAGQRVFLGEKLVHVEPSYDEILSIINAYAAIYAVVEKRYGKTKAEFVK